MVESMKELQIHLDAFEHYFVKKQTRMNVVTAVKSTASEFKVTTKTISSWYRYHWAALSSLRMYVLHARRQRPIFPKTAKISLGSIVWYTLSGIARRRC